MQYQSHYTKNPVAREKMYDEQIRSEKAEKMISVIRDYLGGTENLSVLDISCSTGIISRYLSRNFGRVSGIDIDESAVAFAVSNSSEKNLEFHVMDALNTSFPDNSFDVVICNQMYEHVPDAQILLNEIYRILVPGGICYFGATNRLKVIETHYGNLPFLSYLPKSLSNLYLRISGRGKYYYENLYTHRSLKKICRNFHIVDYTAKVVSRPEDFAAGGMIVSGSFQQRIALFILRYLYWLSPGYIWLLIKPGQETRSGD